MTIERVCQCHCGRVIGWRLNKRYASGACKQRAYRARCERKKRKR